MITTTRYAAGSPLYYAIGQAGGRIYTAVESTRLGAFMAVAWQLAVAGYMKSCTGKHASVQAIIKCKECAGMIDHI